MGWTELAAHVDGARARFAAAAATPRAAQEALLASIMAHHAGSDFGRRHGFAQIDGLAAFQRMVPLRDPQQHAADIAAMAEGDSRRLVDEPLLAFEYTGGSSGAARLIPLTASGLAALQNGLYAWIDDLCTARPAVTAGSSYWSISPVARAPGITRGGVRIGLASDAAYFGAAAPALASVLAVPPAVASIAAIDDWRMLTLQILLCDASLALVSVWSPTFWLELCRHAVLRRAELAQAIADGRWAAAIPSALQVALPAPAADPARARMVAAALSAARPDWPAIWPQLALISCWADASAGPWAQQLSREFPAAPVQGKGLLATEGMLSVALCDGGDPVAAITSSVIEFEDDHGRVLACDEVQCGAEYAVVMSTSAGLYRYRLGDRVRITGWWSGAPRMRLLGRGSDCSDLCGEKLTEAFVLASCASIGIDAGLAARLLPQLQPAPRYELLLDAQTLDAHAAAQLALRLDEALSANPQYAHARELGQLGAVSARRIDLLAARLQALSQARGQRLGDAKPGVLGRVDDPDLAQLTP